MNIVEKSSLLAQIHVPSFDEQISAPKIDSSETLIFEEEHASANDVWAIPFYDAWLPWAGTAFFIVLLFMGGTLYSMLRIRHIRSMEKARMQAEPPGLAMSMFLEDEAHGQAHGQGSDQAIRWQQALEHSRSDNPNDWRLAIIEADILLDGLADSRGYQGETLGEKLKQVNRNSWNTIDMAWEAHKIRNQIAHKGSEYNLTKRETKRIIGLYQTVFEEFKYVS